MTYRVKNLPERVKVGTSNYNLVAADKDMMDELGRYGDCNPETRTIRIADEQPEASHALDTVVHELFHACFRAYNIEPEREEEYTVTALAAAFTDVLISNPDLRRWIENISKR